MIENPESHLNILGYYDVYLNHSLRKQNLDYTSLAIKRLYLITNTVRSIDRSMQ